MSCELFPIFLLHVEVGVSFLLHKPAVRGKSRLDREILRQWESSSDPRVPHGKILSVLTQKNTFLTRLM